MENTEMLIFQLILHAGNGRSSAMEAIAEARNGNYEKSRKKMEECQSELNEAHHIQTSLIQEEVSGEKMEISLLMIHAQDHLMNAITMKEMAGEIINLYSIVEKIEEVKL